jgi:hypothetical protein
MIRVIVVAIDEKFVGMFGLLLKLETMREECGGIIARLFVVVIVVFVVVVVGVVGALDNFAWCTSLTFPFVMQFYKKSCACT